MLLFDYINCLPNKSDDVIHVETDSFYFETKHKNAMIENLNNYEGEFNCKIGNELGNVKLEKEKCNTIFVWKKFYYIDEKCMRIKGIPLKTIDEHGNEVKLVNRELYEKVLNGEKAEKEFYTMKKSLFGEIYISSHKITRAINPKDYTKYFN